MSALFFVGGVFILAVYAVLGLGAVLLGGYLFGWAFRKGWDRASRER